MDKEIPDDLLDSFILTILKRGNIRWTLLERKILTTYHSSATRIRFDNRLRYLLKKENIKRINWGIYRITDKGTKYIQKI